MCTYGVLDVFGLGFFNICGNHAHVVIITSASVPSPHEL
jgi:hypothetical protein